MKFLISVIDDVSNSGTPAEMLEIDKFNDELYLLSNINESKELYETSRAMEAGEGPNVTYQAPVEKEVEDEDDDTPIALMGNTTAKFDESEVMEEEVVETVEEEEDDEWS